MLSEGSRLIEDAKRNYFLNPFRLCGPLEDHQKKFSKNRNFLELSQNRYRAYFKHADYEYEHDF